MITCDHNSYSFKLAALMDPVRIAGNSFHFHDPEFVAAYHEHIWEAWILPGLEDLVGEDAAAELAGDMTPDAARGVLNFLGRLDRVLEQGEEV